MDIGIELDLSIINQQFLDNGIWKVAAMSSWYKWPVSGETIIALF